MYYPSKFLHCSVSYTSWIANNYKKETSLREELHKIAENNNREEDCRENKIQRNKVKKLNNHNKQKYYQKAINIEKVSKKLDPILQLQENEKSNTSKATHYKCMWRTTKT